MKDMELIACCEDCKYYKIIPDWQTRGNCCYEILKQVTTGNDIGCKNFKDRGY